jgi:DNA polymerase-3 subunit delta
MPRELSPVYLIAGTDEAKIAVTRSRLRARAHADGGAAALESIPPDARGAPSAEGLLAALSAMSLTSTRRYLLADGVQLWRSAEQEAIAAALVPPAPETTVVLVAHGKPPAKLVAAVREAGGELLEYEAPRPRDLPAYLAKGAASREFTLERGAARLLAERLGASPLRLANELDRLALWAGPGGKVGAGDILEMTADVSEAAAWSLSDAIIERDPERAVSVAERLLAQGESVTGLVYMVASQLRRAVSAAAALEAGRSRKQVESELGLRPWIARRLFERLGETSLEDLRAATAAIADLEVWCRGGVDYGESLSLTLALRRAASPV